MLTQQKDEKWFLYNKIILKLNQNQLKPSIHKKGFSKVTLIWKKIIGY